MSTPDEPSPAHSGHHHRRDGPDEVPTAIVTVSDTRTLETDTGGALVEEMLHGAGQPVTGRRIVPDESEAIRAALDEAMAESESRAVVFTGGTGIAPRDVTPDALESELDRLVPGFGELFRMLSYEEIGSAALMSRALAGLAKGRVVFVIPGSRGAVRLAASGHRLPQSRGIPRRRRRKRARYQATHRSDGQGSRRGIELGTVRKGLPPPTAHRADRGPRDLGCVSPELLRRICIPDHDHVAFRRLHQQ